MKRTAFEKLILWKNDPDRKPLILKGARQVAKRLMEEFGKRQYKKAISASILTRGTNLIYL